MSVHKENIKSIFIICTGNSCRSIMAEGYLSKRFIELGKDIQVASAGTIATEGMVPVEKTIQVMKESGIDVSGYRSHPLRKDAIASADLIIAMEPIHKEAVMGINPAAENKIYYLREFASEKSHNLSIPDPIGKTIEFYRETLNIIEKSAEGFLKWLEN